MAKRFTDTNKYKNPFIRGLQGPYKLLWDYLYHDCDHAGIWIVDFDIVRIYLGDSEINKEDALKYFNEGEERIIEIDKGEKWFILPFIEFQYGKLNPENRVHNSVINVLVKYNLWNPDKGLTSPLQGRKDKDKDKDKDKGGMGGKTYIEQIIQLFQESFPGYIIVNSGKEKQSASNLLRALKKQYPDYNSDEMLQALQDYFEKCKAIKDPWLKNNMSLAIMSSKYNEINRIINVKKDNNERKGATLEGIEAFRRNLSIQ